MPNARPNTVMAEQAAISVRRLDELSGIYLEELLWQADWHARIDCAIGQ